MHSTLLVDSFRNYFHLLTNACLFICLPSSFLSTQVSCVSFMEPLTKAKVDQLDTMSIKRSRTSIPHRRFCQRRKERLKNTQQIEIGNEHMSESSISDLAVGGDSRSSKIEDVASDFCTPLDDIESNNFLLTGFDDQTTFENKTICLISRYPFWTAFRRFLSHLHVMSGSSSDLPIERCISHLLLTVPVPRPGGQSVLVPLPTLNGPMVLSMPATKDLPLLDLPFQRLFACLDVPSVVTIVLGFLALERKVRQNARGTLTSFCRVIKYPALVISTLTFQCFLLRVSALLGHCHVYTPFTCHGCLRAPSISPVSF